MYSTPRAARQGGRRQHTGGRPGANSDSSGRGPAAVAAAGGCQGSRFLAIGTAPTAVCAACSAPQPRPPHPFRDTNPGAAPQPHAHREPSGGHAARQALDASPSPQAAGPRQPDLDKATTTPSALGVLDLRGSSAERHVLVGHGN